MSSRTRPLARSFHVALQRALQSLRRRLRRFIHRPEIPLVQKGSQLPRGLCIHGKDSLTDGEGRARGGLLADGDAVPRDGRLGLREEAARGAAIVAVAHDCGAGGLLVGLDAAEGALRRGAADEDGGEEGRVEDQDDEAGGEGRRPRPQGAAVALKWEKRFRFWAYFM